MKTQLTYAHTSAPPYSLLSHLWLHEPDGETLTRAASELGLPSADPAELAPAYTDVFLLDVYPYGTAFTDPYGELNGPAAQGVAALYEARGYRPAELTQVGAPDHLGLCIGFLAQVEAVARPPVDAEVGQFVGEFLEWAPACCLAVERERSAHPFYRALAACTREWLLAETSDSKASNLNAHTRESAMRDPAKRGTSSLQSEIGLRDIVRFFLIPARCGMFLSRSRLGQMAMGLGMRLPFGARFEVAEMLFGAAGDSGQVTALLSALGAEVEQWASAYRAWPAEHPAWQPFATRWLERIDTALQTLARMRESLESPLVTEVYDTAYFG